MKGTKLPLSKKLILVISDINNDIRIHQKKEMQCTEYIEMKKSFVDAIKRAQEIIYAIENNLK